jgi:small subunit ribosomal protein S16
MLAIRMQRTGRSGHAQFRVVVQDSRLNPKSGRVVAYLGSYNPHTKTSTLDGEEVAKYLDNGAQPSERVARLLQKEGVKLPSWVKLSEAKKRAVRHPQKRRSTTPKEEAKPEEEAADVEAAENTEAPAEEPAPETEATEVKSTETAEEPTENS